jgi:hypothetical protein
MPAALSPPTRDSSFASTRWTVVRQAADSQTASQHASSALSELCQIYWRPVYVFLRRQGIAQHDAQDLTQGFFADMIESRAYTRADPLKGAVCPRLRRDRRQVIRRWRLRLRGRVQHVYIYDIATNTWTPGPNVLQGVGYCGSTVFNGLLYLYGGVVQENPRTLTNITQIYNPATNIWSYGPNMI